jgi:fatty-acyl-CoA synthase
MTQSEDAATTHPHFGFFNMAGSAKTVTTVIDEAPMPPLELHEGPTTGELILRSVRRYRNNTAFVGDTGSYTYGEMGHFIASIMQTLKNQGLKRGDGVCMLSANKPEVFLTRLATNLLGLRYTPLNPMGSADDHAYILDNCEAKAIITDTKYDDRIPALRAVASRVEYAFTMGPSDQGTDILALAAELEPRDAWNEANPADICNLTYTGGTTGRSKGAVQRHHTSLANVLMTVAEWDWPKEIRTLCVTPLSHAAGTLIMPTLVQGGTVYIHDGFNADRVLKSIQEDKITVLWLVPTMIYVLLDHPSLATTDTGSLELVVYGASPMSPTRLKDALEHFGPIFMQIYAQTEAPMNVTTLNTADHDLDRPERLASCGQPQIGVQVAMLDDDCKEVPQGDVGEICVRGQLVMEGYWKRPEETAEALKGGWLHTGDMGRVDEEGFVYIVDRKKDMIISGGFNVYPKEVEDVLTSHPDVGQAAVIGVPDEKWGEAVKAVVIPKPGTTLDSDALIAMVKAQKGSVLTPKTLDIVAEIPLTPVGKPDKKALRAQYWQDSDRQVH